MPSLKQQHFYYGAILSAIIEYNPDTSLVLLQPKNFSKNVTKKKFLCLFICYVQ